MAGPGTFEKIVAEIGQAMLPLRDALRSPDAFIAFMQKMGWRVDVIPPPLQDLGGELDTLHDALRGLLGDGGINVGGGLSTGVSADFSADNVARALGAVQGVVNGILGIADAPDSAIPEALRADGFREKFPGQLIDFLIITYLQGFHPAVAFGLRSLGVVKASFAASAGARPPYMHLSLDLADLPRLLGDPAQVLRSAFGWGEPDFDFAAMASQVDNLLASVGVEVAVQTLMPATAAAVQGTQVDLAAPLVRAIKGVVFERILPNDQRLAAEVRLIELPGIDGAPPGLALLPYFAGSLGAALPLTPDLRLIVRSDLDLQGGVALRIRPGAPIETVVGFDSGTPSSKDGSIEAVVERGDAAAAPTLIFGSADGTRLQFRKLGATGGVRLAGDGADVYAEFDLTGLEFVFAPGGADGFIATILPGGGFTVGADLTVGVSHRHGFYFRGTSNLELQIPTHIELGAVEIQALTISAAPDAGGVPVGLGVSFKAELGPIQAVVEQIGLSANLAVKPDHDGNLGPLDVSLGFKPPKGLGLKIDAGIVAGGGYLYFDPDRGEYAGALELEFAGFIEVKAIGLITTRMPDGRPGFSLLIVLTAEFGAGGIQLGFGFTLLGVGGILGLNRRMDFAALAEGVASGAVESVMFPRDVIANAPRIISDLRKFFPPEDGRFLVGPMAKIGWGTPTLVSVSLGVIVEIPPGNIAILGSLKCILPGQDVPLLVLQVNFIGAFEPDKSRLWFFAMLVDSRVLTITIDGGMGLLVYLGDNPDFVLSVGGFHPSFKPPPLPFPVPPRVSMDILNAPGRLIRVSGYFAVTSNTVQFGAKAELRLGFDDFGLEGHLAFDALFRFSPFAFLIEISAGVSLKAFGVGLFSVDLRFQLEGPAPWRAHGRGSISLLFLEISADFDISWGEQRTTTLPPVAVLELLEREVRKPEGWQTRLPAGGANPLVTLRQLPAGDELVLHPLGTLFIHQRAIPLGVRIDRVGAQRPSDGKRFSVAPEPGSGLDRVSVTDDQFAMAQFQDMDDAAKLSRPAYERQDAGLELTAEKGAIASPRVVRRSARYELHIIDNKPPKTTARSAVANGAGTRRAPKLYRPHPAVFGQLLAGSSTARSPLSQREARLRQPFAADETVRVTGDRFVIAYRRNNRQAFPPATASSTTSSFRSEATAADAIADWIRADPSLAGQLQVLRQAEVGGGVVAEPGTWSVASPPPSVVSGADAVRLTGGKVLVAGGADAAGKAVAAAAVYDPIAATWADATPSLTTARQRHTTTKLADGRVVAAGGLGAAGAPLASAEVFEPIAAVWTTPQGVLETARSGHSATAVDGGLLVAGGTGARGAALASAELLDPDTLTWTEVEPMGCARTGHRAVPIDGRVLVIGGALPTGEGERAIAFCEIYDPATKTWAPTGSLRTPRKGHQATLLGDGRVLVTGGDAVPAVPYRVDSLASAEVYDPDTGVWTPVADLPGGGRSGHRSVRTPAGVVVIGGTGRPRATAGYRNVVVFDPGSGAWTTTGSLGTGRWDVPAVDLADGRVLAVGGLTLAGAAAPGPGPAELATTAEIYLP
jgi:N-acetylneuraminic acid mutarotase